MLEVEVGATVEVFYQKRDIIRGTVVDAITFNGKTQYGVRGNDGWTYDVWPNNSVVRRVDA